MCLIPAELELNSKGITVTTNVDQPTTEAEVKFNDDVQIKEIRKISISHLCQEMF